VRGELDRTLNLAFEETWDLARERKVSLRTAAFMLGISRVARATELSGLA
jgi:glutamate dehydrogenase (NAD(P)+)